MRVIDEKTGENLILHSTKELAADLEDHSKSFVCDHHSKVLRAFIDAGGANHLKYQCKHCGASVGTSIKKTPCTTSTESWDNQAAEKFQIARRNDNTRIIQKHINIQQRRESSRQREYDAYLKTPEWESLRKKVFERSAGLCEGCREQPATQVHHLSYKNFRKEFLFELVAICKTCHDRIHIGDEESVVDIEPPCCDCVWGDYADCLKFEISQYAAMAPSGPCGPNRSELEPYK